MADSYKMTIAGLERELPLCRLNEHLRIAAFVIFGDVEITVASAAALLKNAPTLIISLRRKRKASPWLTKCPGRAASPILSPARVPKAI